MKLMMMRAKKRLKYGKKWIKKGEKFMVLSDHVRVLMGLNQAVLLVNAKCRCQQAVERPDLAPVSPETPPDTVSNTVDNPAQKLEPLKIKGKKPKTS